jgi:uncharacterized protein (DUF1778 family)
METDQSIQDEYEQRRAEGREFDGLVPVDASVKRNADSIYSLRFTKAEVATLRAAAAARGMKMSEFLRQAALREAADLGSLDPISEAKLHIEGARRALHSIETQQQATA